MKRPLLLSCLVASAVMTGVVNAAEDISLRVIGQPMSIGLIQKNVEQPFFENLANSTGLPLDVNYKALDTTGIKDEEQLRVLKSGMFDVVSLRLSQVSRDEPTILGLDLVGLNPTYQAGAQTIEKYQSVVDERLQQRFNTKLLGLWPFGPQVLFCNHPIESLSDTKGLKVRVYDQNLAKFVESLGGVPVPIGFGDVHQSLALGVVDCAITGSSSANTAGWPEVATHMLPIGFQLGINGYGINLNTWNKMSEKQQETLQSAFDGLVSEIWSYSEELYEESLRCNVGEKPCENLNQYQLVKVPVSDSDLKTVSDTVMQTSFPAWAELCDQTNSTCSSDWTEVMTK